MFEVDNPDLMAMNEHGIRKFHSTFELDNSDLMAMIEHGMSNSSSMFGLDSPDLLTLSEPGVRHSGPIFELDCLELMLTNGPNQDGNDHDSVDMVEEDRQNQAASNNLGRSDTAGSADTIDMLDTGPTRGLAVAGFCQEWMKCNDLLDTCYQMSAVDEKQDVGEEQESYHAVSIHIPWTALDSQPVQLGQVFSLPDECF